MTLDELREEWKKDCEIDTNDLSKATVSGPILHAKYLDALISYKLKYTKLNSDIVEYRQLRTRYYKGELSREELQEKNWDQWQYKTLKSEIDNLISAEPNYLKLVLREDYIKAAIYYLESVLNEIRARSFHCKNLIEYMKFRAGA